MSGVEILHMEEVVVDTAYSWDVFLVAFFMIFLTCIVFGIACGLKENDLTAGILGGLIAGVACGIVVGIFAGAGIGEPIATELQYKVSINDSVSMNEFLDKYEIIDVEGKIFTVRELTD